MSLESLLNTAYARGTGVSLETAKRSAGRSLIETIYDLGNYQNKELTNEQLSLMVYLGERLADEAFKTLPKNLRDAAKAWPSQTRQQRIKTLSRMTTELKGAQWYERVPARKQLSRRRPNVAAAVLPREHGSWTRGTEIPNCLGLAQMMIGFARATGSRHTLVNTLIPPDEAAEIFICQWLAKLQDILQQRPDLAVARGRARIVESSVKRGLAILAKQIQREAHHALYIEVTETEWLVVDPFLGRRPAPISGMLTNAVFDLEPGDEEKYAWMEERYLEHVTAESKWFDDVYKELITEPVSTISIANRYFESVNAIFVKEHLSILTSLLRSTEFHSQEIQRAFTRLRKRRFHSDTDVIVDNFERWTWLGEKGSEPLTDDERKAIRLAKQRNKTNRRRRQQAYARAVRCVTSYAYEAIFELAFPPVAPAIEIAHPTNHLGAATIHHLASLNGEVVPDILRYTSSQFTLRDIMSHRPHLDAALQAIVDRRVKHLKTTPKRAAGRVVLPSMLTHLNNE